MYNDTFVFHFYFGLITRLFFFFFFFICLPLVPLVPIRARSSTTTNDFRELAFGRGRGKITL